MDRSSVAFFERPYPSANSALLQGECPLLVDTGFGSDVADLERWLSAQGTAPTELKLIVNTHHHSDHVGGNHWLQTAHGLPIAAHGSEGHAVNRRDPEACLGRWLRQPVEAYTVTHLLREGDTLSAGGAPWHVLHTPGHSPGHLVLYQPEEGVALTGDALLPGDVGWLKFHQDFQQRGLEAADQALDTLARLAELDLRLAYPGHGPVITGVAQAIQDSRTRLERFRLDPEKAGWHAAKRIFAFALMIDGPLSAEELAAYLLESPWFVDHAREVFRVTAEELLNLLVAEMLRSGAARWDRGRLHASGPHRSPPRRWARSPTTVAQWPPG